MLRRKADRIAAAFLGVVVVSCPQQVGAHSVASEQSSNNDRVMAAQKYGGVRKSTGEVTVTYYGHMAFKITSPRGLEVFIDPWGNDPTGRYEMWYQMHMPETRTDIALITHAHFDHDATERLDATMILDRMSGRFELGDVKILGIAEKHVCEPQGKYPFRSLIIAIDKDPCPPDESTQWDNSMYVIETGGLRFLHWGDNRQNPPDHVWEMIGKVDVAFLPVSDDGHILSPSWADVVMKKLGAKIVVPCHYYITGIGVPHAGGLEPALEWTRKHKHTLLDTPTVALTPEKVATYDQHVLYFGDHVPFAVTGTPPEPQKAMPPVPEPAKAWERFTN
jgi:L-ascorbate metabolism protein UlaG (beta-lactamase superfamily)